MKKILLLTAVLSTLSACSDIEFFDAGGFGDDGKAIIGAAVGTLVTSWAVAQWQDMPNDHPDYNQ